MGKKICPQCGSEMEEIKVNSNVTGFRGPPEYKCTNSECGFIDERVV